jgi:AcrR family transcriptional regulator
MTKIKTLPSPHFRADPTRAKILKAARMLFVKFGFSATSIGAIAEKANINHSLIFHHFGNKEGLWKAVKQSIVEEADKLCPTLPELTLSLPNFLEKLITQNIFFYRNNPDIVRMINWQRLEYEKKKQIGITLSPQAQDWLMAFKHYQANGSISSSLKPEFIMTLVLSIVSSAAMDPNVFITKTQDLSEYVKFCVKQLLKAFK